MPSKTIVAIIAITILALAAIITGTDSGLLVGATTAIAGLGGFAIGKASAAKKKD